MKRKLTDLCTIQYGYAFDSESFTSDNDYMPLVRIRDVKRGFSETFYTGDFSPEYVIHSGDLLVGMDGEFNIARWKSGDALLNQRVCKITAADGTDEQYLRFALQKALKEIEAHTAFVTVKHLSAKELNKLVLDIPDTGEQARIAQILCKLERVISGREEELSALDDLIKARFVEMFGDVIKNSKGWPKYTFSEIATSRLGKMLDAKRQTGEHRFPYLANFNVQWFRFELASLNEMDFDEDDQKEFELKEGDLLVCEGGEIGRCAVWHNDVQPCFFQKALHRVRCDTGIVLPDYLARWFQYNCEHGGFASIEGAKATIAHLPGAKLKALQVVVPPIELQEQFISFIAQIDKSKSAIQKSLDETQILFDSLMQKYFG